MINLCVTRNIGCCEEVDQDVLEAAGCVFGDLISDVLIQTEQVGESVGRAYLDTEGYDFDIVDASCSLQGEVIPGLMAEASDKEQGTYIGEVQSFTIQIDRSGRDGLSAYSTVNLERLTDNE